MTATYLHRTGANFQSLCRQCTLIEQPTLDVCKYDLNVVFVTVGNLLTFCLGKSVDAVSQPEFFIFYRFLI